MHQPPSGRWGLNFLLFDPITAREKLLPTSSEQSWQHAQGLILGAKLHCNKSSHLKEVALSNSLVPTQPPIHVCKRWHKWSQKTWSALHHGAMSNPPLRR